MDNDKIGQLVTTSGIVVRMSQPTIIRLKKCYICTKCKSTHEVKVSI
jgi:DNA replicative helicase MCM subunit Mcm2 (Cdc46/Mcm family)